jgi:hypothetical protein
MDHPKKVERAAGGGFALAFLQKLRGTYDVGQASMFWVACATVTGRIATLILRWC